MKPANASKDFLTNCYTREAFIPFLKKLEEEYLTHKKPFAVLMMDVDHFKFFNDRFGHMVGDEVLKYFSSSLRLDLEDEENVPFRFGGDEFVMVFPNKTSNEALHLAARLRKNIRTRSCLVKGKQISVTFSGGVASYPSDANNIEDVIEKADKALYYSKNHGRGRIIKFNDLAKKEFLQMFLVVTILASLGGVFYLNRDGLTAYVSHEYGRFSAWMAKNYPSPPPAPEPAVMSLPQKNLPTLPAGYEAVLPQGTPAAGGPAEPQPLPLTNEILLESGRVVKGVIQHEDDDVVEVEVSLQEGKGILQLKKSQIVRIRRGIKAAS